MAPQYTYSPLFAHQTNEQGCDPGRPFSRATLSDNSSVAEHLADNRAIEVRIFVVGPVFLINFTALDDMPCSPTLNKPCRGAAYRNGCRGRRSRGHWQTRPTIGIRIPVVKRKGASEIYGDHGVTVRIGVCETPGPGSIPGGLPVFLLSWPNPAEALVSETRGWRFDSSRQHHFPYHFAVVAKR